jgi:hypothetical protein
MFTLFLFLLSRSAAAESQYNDPEAARKWTINEEIAQRYTYDPENTEEPKSSAMQTISFRINPTALAGKRKHSRKRTATSPCPAVRSLGDLMRVNR